MENKIWPHELREIIESFEGEHYLALGKRDKIIVDFLIQKNLVNIINGKVSS